MRLTKQSIPQKPSFEPYTITLHIDDRNDDENLKFLANCFVNDNMSGMCSTPLALIADHFRLKGPNYK